MKKKIILSLLGVVFLYLSPNVIPAQTPPGTRDLDVTILPECGESCHAGQPLKVTYTVSNNTNAPVHFLKWGTPLEGFKTDMFDIRGPRGNKIKYNGILVTRVGPFPSDYVTIPPHQRISGQLDLAKAYDLPEEGVYIITPRTHRTEFALQKPTHFSSQQIFNQKLIKPNPFSIRQIGRRPPASTRPTAPPGLRQISPGTSVNPPGGYFLSITSLPPDNLNLGTQITDTTQWSAVKLAYLEALRLAAGAKLALNGTPFEEIQRGATRYNIYFGKADRTRVDYVRDVFGVVYGFGLVPDTLHPLKILMGTDKDCGVVRDPGTGGICPDCCQDSNCPDCLPCPGCVPPTPGGCTSIGCCTSIAGYVDPNEISGSRKNVYLCPLFWHLPLTGAADTQAGIILHEMAHLALADTDTTGAPEACYSDRLCRQTARENPEAAKGAADSYRLFASNTNLGMGLERLHISLKTASGGYFLAQNGGGGFVDSCGPPDSSAAVFGLEGIYSLLPMTPLPVRTLSDGNRVSLVTADRKHVVAPDPRPVVQPERLGAVDATRSDFHFFTLKKLGGGSGKIQNGDSVALISQNQGHVATSGCGPRSVTVAGVGSPGAAGIFTVSLIQDSEQPRHYVHLRTESGNFLKSSGINVDSSPWPVTGSSSRPVTHYPAASAWAAPCSICTFILIDKNGGPLLDGDPVQLLTYDGVHYVTEKILHMGGSLQMGVLSAISTSVNSQQFKIQLSDRRQAIIDRRIQNGDLIELWTLGGRTYPNWKFRIELGR
jgi:hypothetical protein